MLYNNKKEKIARIIELPIPIPIWDMLEDLMTEYGNPVNAILASIKAHHQEKFGSLDEIKIAPALFFNPISAPAISKTSGITNGQLAKITENSKKFEKRTQREIEKVDELLQKINDLGTLKELKSEISAMKAMLNDIKAGGFSPSRGARIRHKADLSSLDISVSDGEEIPLTPPERPSLDSVLDSVLLFDDEEEEGNNNNETENDEDKEDKS